MSEWMNLIVKLTVNVMLSAMSEDIRDDTWQFINIQQGEGMHRKWMNDLENE